MPLRRLLPLLLGAALIALLLMWQPWDAADDAGFDDGTTTTAHDAAMHAGDAGRAEAGLGGRAAESGDPAVVERGPVLVRVIGHRGRPLAGIPVRLMGPGKVDTLLPGHETRVNLDTGETMPGKDRVIEVQGLVVKSSLLTDADGEVVFPDLPYDGSHAAEVVVQQGRNVLLLGRAGRAAPSIELFFDDKNHEVPEGSIVILDDIINRSGSLSELDSSQGVHRRTIEGPETRIEVPAGLPFRFIPEDAATGRPLRSVAWEAAPRFTNAEAKPEGPNDLLPVEVGQSQTISTAFKAPRGRVLHEDPTFPGWISPEAKRLEARLPLRAEAQIVIVLEGEVRIRDISKLEGQVWIPMMPAPQSNTFELDAFGRLHVRGLPHLPGEMVAVDLTYEGKRIHRADVPIGTDPAQAVVIEVTPKKPDPEESENVETDISSFLYDDFEIITGTFPTSRHTYTRDFDHDPKTTGRLAMRVLRPDGTPAHGALIGTVEGDWSLYAREDGRVLFKGLPPGKHRMFVLGAGAVSFHDAEITAGAETRLEVRADEGGRIALEVVDEQGRPVPYATITIEQPSGYEWAEVIDGVQRLDPFTNHEGRRTLHRLEPGAVTVNATFGSRYARTKVKVAKGMTQPLRLTLGVDTTDEEKPAEGDSSK